MKALVIGGTGFLGGAIVESALLSGFLVDVLTRQATQPNKKNVRYLTGDRYNDLSNLENDYEVIFDTCGFEPEAFSLLFKRIDIKKLKKYIFVSSVSIYGDYSVPKLVETTKSNTAKEKDFELVTNLPYLERTSAFSFGNSYGVLKKECELLLESTLGTKAVILRSGVLVGAGDYTDRLTWWVRRVDQGEKVICPLPKDRLVQLIDVRDAAEFAVASVKHKLSGIYNLTGHQLLFSKLLETIRFVSKSNAQFNWVNLKNYTDRNLSPWTDIPLVPPSGKQFDYFFDIDISKAISSGLNLRELDETILDVLNWDRDNRNRELKCGYDKETEQAVASDQATLG